MGFFTDTSVCIGCKACEVACKEWNAVPEDGLLLTVMSYDNTGGLSASTWRHVAFIEKPPADGGHDVRWLMSSDVCKHCTEAACLDVCPTGALMRTEFGTVVVQDDVCNGCGYCVSACPFGVIARRESDGGAHKCTLCYDRIGDGLTPACAKANMLRVVKATSPMSIGTWILSAYTPLALGAAASAVTRKLPRAGLAATLPAAVLGPAVASYTSVLLADTTVPAWHDAHRELPFVFAGSAVTAAGGLGMLAVRPDGAGQAVRFAVLGAAAELTAKSLLLRRLGSAAEPYQKGRAGTIMEAGEVLTAAGLAGAVLAGRSRAAVALFGAALMAASALTRFGVFEAGRASARDPNIPSGRNASASATGASRPADRVRPRTQRPRRARARTRASMTTRARTAARTPGEAAGAGDPSGDPAGRCVW